MHVRNEVGLAQVHPNYDIVVAHLIFGGIKWMTSPGGPSSGL